MLASSHGTASGSKLSTTSAAQTTFEAMVERWSDEHDVSDAGDYGSHDTHTLTSDALALHALSLLAVGAVSQPVETEEGFAIYQRTAERARARLAVSEILVTHTDTIPDLDAMRPARTRPEALRVANTLQAALKRNPASFTRLQRQHCELATCQRPPSAWSEGSCLAGMERALAGLWIGQVGATPIETPLGFHFLRREDPSRVPSEAPAISFEMPKPPPQTFAFVFDHGDQEQVIRLLRGVALSASARQVIGASERAAFGALARGVEAELAACDDGCSQRARSEMRARFDRELTALLGGAGHAAFGALADEVAKNHQLTW